MTQISDGRGRHPSTTIGVRKLVIALSCGIKISAVHHVVSSQCTRVADGQNYDYQDRASIAARAVKTVCNVINQIQQESNEYHDTQVNHTLTYTAHNCFVFIGNCCRLEPVACTVFHLCKLFQWTCVDYIVHGLLQLPHSQTDHWPGRPICVGLQDMLCDLIAIDITGTAYDNKGNNLAVIQYM